MMKQDLKKILYVMEKKIKLVYLNPREDIIYSGFVETDRDRVKVLTIEKDIVRQYIFLLDGNRVLQEERKTK